MRAAPTFSGTRGAAEMRPLFDDALANGDRHEWFARGDYEATVRGSRPLAATYYVSPSQHLGLEPMYGEVQGHPELRVASVSQEHGVIRAAAPAAIEGKFKVGERIEIIPNHSCLTEAHFDEYVVVERETVIDRWQIERGR